RAVVAVVAVALVDARQPEQGFLVTAAVAVDGHRDHRATGLFGPRHKRLGDVPAVGGVELVPDRRPARGGDVLDAGGGRRRQDLAMVAGLRAAGGIQFAFG